MRRPLPALAMLLVALVVCSAPALAATPGAGFSGPRWSIGPLIATYAGPSHADLLFRTNEVMVSGMASEPGILLSDFETGTPAGLRAYFAYRPALGLAATYNFSNYSSAQDFTAHGWNSPRELTTDLHELDFTVHYGLDFVRNHRILPYVGFGVGIAMADSRLSIDLVNTPGVHEDADDPDSPLLANRQFEIEARDTTMTYMGLAGMIYRFGGRFAVNAEIQGVMGDIRQTFEYAGSLQHMVPNPENHTAEIEDWGLNDILGGSYPMDLNGMRLSVGVLVGL